ncbi:uncharacterized protein LOC131164491 isoform X2 [Malania oleifera]|uniref:uncharacterized protein LOC131164491 isoform X2 n=1 Tax=Malania oleifera TaxID=397392 RepID=UPI0025ADC19F|nr:uncharacterized protein LOC131164491 isoform X2 [Malania oleifera]
MAGSLSSTLALCTSFLSSPQKSQTTPSSFSTFNIDDKPSLICCSKKKASFVDQILDYIEGGPKLRKWYGAPDLLPKDGSAVEEEDESSDVEEARDAVLVTDGDGEIGQALVKDKRAAVEAFGTYVESMTGEANDRLFLKKALRGVRAIICSNEGFFSKVGSLDGVQHVILLSQLSVYRGTAGVQALIKSNARKLAEEDESIVMASGIPYTVIRVGLLENTLGGKQGFSFKEGGAAKGRLSKEDAAFICVEALDTVPRTGLIFEVVNGEKKISDWKKCFTALMEKAEQ